MEPCKSRNYMCPHPWFTKAHYFDTSVFAQRLRRTLRAPVPPKLYAEGEAGFKWNLHKRGISVIEAVIALLIITIMVSVLLTSQGNSLRTGVSSMLEKRVTQALEQRFVEIDKDHIDARKKAVTSELQPPLPAGTITYSARKPSPESSLHAFENVYIETLTARWQNRGRETVTQLVRLHTYPPEEKKNDARE